MVIGRRGMRGQPQLWDNNEAAHVAPNRIA
jgi:hypothetical protein